MPKKTVYYRDLSDDFAGTENIRTEELDESFVYVHKNIVWRAAAFILYNIIARPLVWLIATVGYGLKFENRRLTRQLKGQGYFLYANHTGWIDAFICNLACFPHRGHVIANPDAVSIPGLRTIVMMLGCLPLPSTVRGMRNFRDAVELRIGQGRVVSIYPEAHIWPYCNFIRPFPAASFSYPAKLGTPVVVAVSTFRRRKLLGTPGYTVRMCGPFYPDMTLPLKERERALHDTVYAAMCDIAARPDNEEIIAYRPMEEKEFQPK